MLPPKSHSHVSHYGRRHGPSKFHATHGSISAARRLFGSEYQNQSTSRKSSVPILVKDGAKVHEAKYTAPDDGTNMSLYGE